MFRSVYIFIIFATIAFPVECDYYLDVWILTNQRIFDIEQRGLFNRHISVFEINKIQDVNVKIEGIIATFIKYGDVNILIKEADNPLEVKKAILEQYANLMQKTGSQNTNPNPLPPQQNKQ